MPISHEGPGEMSAGQDTSDDRCFTCHDKATIHGPGYRVGHDEIMNSPDIQCDIDQDCIMYLGTGKGGSDILPRLFSAIRNRHAFCVVPDRWLADGGQSILSSPDARGMQTDHESFVMDLAKPVFQVLTGGTTGHPKRLLRTHGSWLDSFEVNRKRWDIRPDDRYGILGNLSHSIALYASMEALHVGADLHLMSSIRHDRQRGYVDSERITVLYATPAQLRQMVFTDRACGHGADSVRLIMVGGSRLDKSLRNACQNMFRSASVVEFYGTSETSFITIADEGVPDGSVGKPYPNVSLRMGVDGGGTSGEGQGEILVKSPYMFLGYVLDGGMNNSMPGRFNPANCGVMTPVTSHDGFFATGEIGWMDKDGNLTITGRKDRMYTVADVNVFPETVEECLMDAEGVLDACAYPVADERRGSVTHASLLVSKDNANTAMIKSYCRKRMGPLAAPRRYRFFYDRAVFNQARATNGTLKL